MKSTISCWNVTKFLSSKYHRMLNIKKKLSCWIMLWYHCALFIVTFSTLKKQGTKVLIFYLIFTKLSFSFNHVTLHQCQWKLKKQLHRHLHVIRIKRDIDSEIEFISTYSIHVRDFTAIWPSIEMLLKWPSLRPDGCNFW